VIIQVVQVIQVFNQVIIHVISEVIK